MLYLLFQLGKDRYALHTRQVADKTAGTSETIDPAPNTFVEKPSIPLR